MMEGRDSPPSSVARAAEWTRSVAREAAVKAAIRVTVRGVTRGVKGVVPPNGVRAGVDVGTCVTVRVAKDFKAPIRGDMDGNA